MNFTVSALRNGSHSLMSGECKNCQASSNGFLKINKSNGSCHVTNTSAELSDGSRNSTATTTSGSNSTTSSKIKLTSSPTDSLVKNSPNSLNPSTALSNYQPMLSAGNNCQCCSSVSGYAYGAGTAGSETASPLVDDFDNNAYQIMKLINEHKTCVCPTKTVCTKGSIYNNKSTPSTADQHSMELFAFNLFKSGGFLEVPKYGKPDLVQWSVAQVKLKN